MVSWLLAEALRDMGHHVEHRNPTMTEDYEEFDHVFLGLAAMHSVGCNRSYGFLAAYLKNQPNDKVTFYVDDVDTGKVLSGLRVMQNDPKKLIKPFYVYRLEYALASLPEWHKWLMQGIDNLVAYAWPRVIIPMFPWGDPEKYRSQLPNAVDLLPIDFSSYVPEYVGPDEWSPDPERKWVTEMSTADRWFQQQRHIYSLKQFGHGNEKRPHDHGLTLEYAKHWGVIEKGLDNGFFHSRPIYAAQARTLYVTRWQNFQALGAPYGLLADKAAGFTEDERITWASEQAEVFDTNTHSRNDVKDALSSILGSKVNV